MVGGAGFPLFTPHLPTCQPGPPFPVLGALWAASLVVTAPTAGPSAGAPALMAPGAQECPSARGQEAISPPNPPGP